MGTTNINPKILEDIKRKIKQNKAIPTAGFQQRTQIYKEELTRTCRLVRQDMSLIDELLLPRGVTGTIEHLHSQGNNRLKRLIGMDVGVGIAVFTGLFAANEIFQLSSEINAVRENQKHISSIVKRLAQTEEFCHFIIQHRLTGFLTKKQTAR